MDDLSRRRVQQSYYSFSTGRCQHVTIRVPSYTINPILYFSTNSVRIKMWSTKTQKLPEWILSKVLTELQQRLSNILMLLSLHPIASKFPLVRQTSIQVAGTKRNEGELKFKFSFSKVVARKRKRRSKNRLLTKRERKKKQ